LDFERAAAVFLDPLAVTIPDEEHIARPRRGGLRWGRTLRVRMYWSSTRLHNWTLIGGGCD
jgi:hypothetical protein